jgi:hypothetical protein
MTRGVWCAVLVVVGLGVAEQSEAQALNGLAEWVIARSLFATDGKDTRDNTFWQAYTVGYKSTFLDPRLLNYLAEFTFLRNGLTLDGKEMAANQTGFKLGANLFPSRPFPLSIQWRRSIGLQSGNYPISVPLLGGFNPPPGEPLPDVNTIERTFALNWQLNTARLPRIEFAINRDATELTAGDSKTGQRNNSLTFSAVKDTANTHNALRYQEDSFDSQLSDAYTHTYGDLSYEFTRRLSAASRANVRAGRRHTFSLFLTPVQATDTARNPYVPVSGSNVSILYANADLTHAVNQKLSVDLSAALDDQSTELGGSNSALLGSNVVYQPVKGLTVNLGGSYGRRGEAIASADLTAPTGAVTAGAQYGRQVRIFQFNLGGSRTLGWHGGATGTLGAGPQTVMLDPCGGGPVPSPQRAGRGAFRPGAPGRPDDGDCWVPVPPGTGAVPGTGGENQQWTVQAGVSADIRRIVRLLAGHERTHSEDTLFVLGNLQTDRTRVVARTMSGARFNAEASWEQSHLEQGAGEAYSRSVITTFSGALNASIGPDGRIALTGGRYENRSLLGTDYSLFYMASYDAEYRRALRVSLSLRREATVAERANLDQQGYVGLARVDYKLRLFTFGFEYRYTDLALSTNAQGQPIGFRGRQILFRISRKFGIAL